MPAVRTVLPERSLRARTVTREPCTTGRSQQQQQQRMQCAALDAAFKGNHHTPEAL